MGDLAEDEFAVKRITDMRSGRRTVMAGCTDSSESIGKDMVIRRGWNKTDLNCGALVHEWDRDCVRKNRFEVMQSHEEGKTGE